MGVKNFTVPRSSFLSMDKDLNTILDAILKNNVIKKLLFYTNDAPLQQPNLNEKESLSLINKNIKIVPKLNIDSDELNYIIITFDNFTPNATNTEFRDNMIYFDVICHYDQWTIGDLQLRPYRIAAEIDSMFNEKRLSGIGLLHFIGCNQLVINENFAGVTLMFEAIHGEDDKKNALTPEGQERLEENHKELEDLINLN